MGRGINRNEVLYRWIGYLFSGSKVGVCFIYVLLMIVFDCINNKENKLKFIFLEEICVYDERSKLIEYDYFVMSRIGEILMEVFGIGLEYLEEEEIIKVMINFIDDGSNYIFFLN